VDLGGQAHHLQDVLAGAELAVEVVAQQPGHLRPAAELGGQAHQLLLGAAVGRAVLEDPPVPAEGLVEVLDLLLVDLGDALGPGVALLGVLGVLETDLVDGDELGPGVAADVHWLEEVGGLDLGVAVLEQVLELVDGISVIGFPAQHGGQVLEGAVAPPQLPQLDPGQTEMDPHRLAL